MNATDSKKVIRDFKKAVNMTPAALRKWLQDDRSRGVGFKGKDGDGNGESVGHRSGRHILRIKAKKQADLGAEDLQHMEKVVGYVHRHLAQKPSGDIAETPWRYSLMNWGHDPMKAR